MFRWFHSGCIGTLHSNLLLHGELHLRQDTHFTNMKGRHLFPDTLLLTGCIKPVEGQSYLVLKDPEERLRQYWESLKFYLLQTDFKRIIFCENSGYPLELLDFEKLATKNGKELELLSFCGDTERTRIRGKGFGEGEIVAYALSHSRHAADIRHFVKVTGRLIVRNMEDIRNRLDMSHFYINRLLVRNDAEVLDTRLYATPVELYKRYFLNLYTGVSVEFNLEKAFTKCFYDEKIRFRCFPRYPEFHGICGGDGMVYGEESPMLLRTFRLASACGVFNSCWFAGGVSQWRQRRV